MSSLTRTMLPAFALAAMMSVAQAEDAHHPGGAATQTQDQQLAQAPVAQPQQSAKPGMMMNMDQMRPMMSDMMGRQGGMGMPFEHVEGRIAFLKTELKITDAQASRWNTFADTLRANAKALQAMHESMTKGAPATWPDRLVAQQKMLGMRLDGLKTLEAAGAPLYAALTDEQKKVADLLLSGPTGMM